MKTIGQPGSSALLLLVAITVWPALAQSAIPFYPAPGHAPLVVSRDTLDCKKGTPADRLTHGSYPMLSQAEIVKLVRQQVKQGPKCLWQIRQAMFDSTYTPHIADWIVYIDKDFAIERITQRNKVLDPPILRGEKFLNVVFLLERKPQSKEGVTSDTTDIVLGPVVDGSRPLSSLQFAVKARAPEKELVVVKVRRDILQYRRESFIVQIVSGFGGKIFGAAPGLPEDAGLKDSTISIELKDLQPESPDSIHLFMGRGKVPIEGELWGRLVVDAVPSAGRSTRSIVTNFVNTDRSRLGLSLGVGVLPWGPQNVLRQATSVLTYNPKPDTVGMDSSAITPPDTSRRVADTTYRYTRTSRVIEADTYVLLHWRAWRRQPWPERRSLLGLTRGVFWFESAGVFVGTNLLKHDLGSRIPVGVSLDRLWYSDVGIAGGIVVVKDERFTSGSTKPLTARRVLPFFSITLAL